MLAAEMNSLAAVTAFTDADQVPRRWGHPPKKSPRSRSARMVSLTVDAGHIDLHLAGSDQEQRLHGFVLLQDHRLIARKLLTMTNGPAVPAVVP